VKGGSGRQRETDRERRDRERKGQNTCEGKDGRRETKRQAFNVFYHSMCPMVMVGVARAARGWDNCEKVHRICHMFDNNSTIYS
jgi:hypothetical protein